MNTRTAKEWVDLAGRYERMMVAGEQAHTAGRQIAQAAGRVAALIRDGDFRGAFEATSALDAIISDNCFSPSPVRELRNACDAIEGANDGARDGFRSAALERLLEGDR